MAWGRIDDGHYRHRKVAELDDDLRKGCVALYWLAISWCNDQLSDGKVTMTTVRMLGSDPAEADELVRVGLWEKDGKAFRVHDFLDFNKSREQVESDRAQRAAAGAAGAAKRWGDSGSHGKSSSISPSEMHGGDDAPLPVSRTPVLPAPATVARDEWDDDRPDLEAFLLLTRRAPTPRQRILLDSLMDRHDQTGPQWAADVMMRHPDDPIGAVIEADKAYRTERIAQAQAAEKPKPVVRRRKSMPIHTRELLEHWAKENGVSQDGAA